MEVAARSLSKIYMRKFLSEDVDGDGAAAYSWLIERFPSVIKLGNPYCSHSSGQLSMVKTISMEAAQSVASDGDLLSSREEDVGWFDSDDDNVPCEAEPGEPIETDDEG